MSGSLRRERRAGAVIWGALAAAGALLLAVLITSGAPRSGAQAPVEERPTDSLRFVHEGTEVEVIFRGEVGHDELFDRHELVAGEAGLVAPTDGDGEPEGALAQPRPAWLSFTYRLGDESTDVLVAKEPVMNNVSWNAIARAGAAFGDGVPIAVGGEAFSQDAEFEAADGHRYRVRLPRCGQSTSAPLSEWNLLIGAVHEGDQDFGGERYAWIEDPYGDADLNVGYQGSLSWCAEPWYPDRRKRVVRGYFKVSRFHATTASFSGDRVYWRPVLERIDPDRERGSKLAGHDIAERPEQSPDRKVQFFGALSNAEVFGEGERIADIVGIDAGEPIDEGEPQWLVFRFEGRTLLVASAPVRRSLSWDQIAEAGAVRGDGEVISVDGEDHPQDVEIADIHGNRFRVRLLHCGDATLDSSSEWNRLIGGIHQGDGDFAARPDGIYGWLTSPVPDRALHIVAGHGGATWCREAQQLHGERHAVNRGYLTVARYHVTPSDFTGSGFGWRPVLELVEDDEV